MAKDLKALHKEWSKAKAKFEKFKAKEMDLRMQIDQLLAKDKKDSWIIESDLTSTTFKRNLNYSIPKAGVIDVKANVPKETFNELFTVSYKLKPAVYEALSGECKQAVDKHLVLKPAPPTVTTKAL